jgi:hypothetical protein
MKKSTEKEKRSGDRRGNLSSPDGREGAIVGGFGILMCTQI